MTLKPTRASLGNGSYYLGAGKAEGSPEPRCGTAHHENHMGDKCFPQRVAPDTSRNHVTNYVRIKSLSSDMKLDPTHLIHKLRYQGGRGRSLVAVRQSVTR